MSQSCKTELCNTVQAVVDGVTSSNDTTDLLFTSVAIDKTEPTNRISKITFNDLPNANTFLNGHIVYLDDANVPIISSNCSWIGFDGRVVGSVVENQIWGWGCNNFGQIGEGTSVNRCSPVLEVCGSKDWCQVSAGSSNSAGIKKSGELWVWGSGLCGGLGDGTTVCKFSPVREFCSATDWCQVSTNTSAAAIKTSGELWAWGRNSCGAVGDGTITDKCSLVREFCSATNWCQVSAGFSATAAIKTSGELWAWGRGLCGVIGDGTTVNRCSPVRERCSATNWCQVSFAGSGQISAAAVKTSGQIWAWGANGFGQLGDGTQVTRCSPVRERCSDTNWCQVAISSHTAAIKTSGELWVWGRNCCGRLGDGTTVQRCSPVREFCSATNWCQVGTSGSTGGERTIAIKTSGELWAWGAGTIGILGDGTIVPKCSPVREISSSTNWCQVSVGSTHTNAIKTIVCVCR